MNGFYPPEVPVIGEYTHYPDLPHLKGRTVQLLRGQGSYSGRCHVCDYEPEGMRMCNEPLCSSEFAWIKDGLVLFYMYTACDFVVAAWLFPFRTVQGLKP
jgi:hypothetical protein